MPGKGRPFQKGHKSKGGRPKGRTLNETLQKLVEIEMTSAGGEKMPAKEALVRVLIREAMSGESWAHHIIWDRIEGKVPDALKISGDAEAPVRYTLSLGE